MAIHPAECANYFANAGYASGKIEDALGKLLSAGAHPCSRAHDITNHSRIRHADPRASLGGNGARVGAPIRILLAIR